jgi:hypothetical protein
MSDFIPKPGIKIGGLSRKAQKLQALREKAAAASTGTSAKPIATTPTPTFKATSNVARKTTFQRKAV